VYLANSLAGGGGTGQYFWDTNDERWKMSSRTAINAVTVDTRKKASFGFDDVIVLQSLQFDGGTGHIDLWVKQFDEESLLATYMPQEYSGLTDYGIIQQNRAKYASLKTAFGTNYRFLNVPLPKRFDGPYRTQHGNMPRPNDCIILIYPDNSRDTLCGDEFYDLDPRGYLNGTTVNKTYIYPSFSRTPADPSWQSDSIAREILQKLLPGYRLVPIDSRMLTPWGGAIHCITMQIPQDPEKLITIRHRPWRDYVELAQSFDISAEIVSATKADTVLTWWKKINDTEWQLAEMVNQGNNVWTTSIQGNFEKEDTIRYFIEAINHSNDLYKAAPITGGKGADEGYYQFYFDETSIDELYGFEPKASIIASIYPNPATDYLNVVFEHITGGNVTIEVVNSLGQTLSTPVNQYLDRGVFIFEITNLDLRSGVYFLKMTTASGVSAVNFIVK
jgi:hypothetical protein